jgi:hypothetical protein
MRKGSRKGRCPLCREEEDVLALKYLETRMCKEIFFSRKWVSIIEELCYKRMTECTNVTEVRNIGKYL